MTPFIQQLLAEQGIPANLDPAVRSEFEAELASRLNEFINARILDAMPAVVVQRFEALLESDPDEAVVQRFVERNVPNQQEVVTNAMVEFRRLYLGSKAE
jgi:hypothetical protein